MVVVVGVVWRGVIDGWAGIMRGHGRAVELTPNRLNQGFSRTFVNSLFDLACGDCGERNIRRVRGRAKGGGGGWRVREALTGPEVKSAIWCFRKGADWSLIQCKENDKQAVVVVFGGWGGGVHRKQLGGLFCRPRCVKLCDGYR